MSRMVLLVTTLACALAPVAAQKGPQRKKSPSTRTPAETKAAGCRFSYGISQHWRLVTRFRQKFYFDPQGFFTTAALQIKRRVCSLGKNALHC